MLECASHSQEKGDVRVCRLFFRGRSYSVLRDLVRLLEAVGGRRDVRELGLRCLARVLLLDTSTVNAVLFESPLPRDLVNELSLAAARPEIRDALRATTVSSAATDSRDTAIFVLFDARSLFEYLALLTNVLTITFATGDALPVAFACVYPITRDPTRIFIKNTVFKLHILEEEFFARVFFVF